MLCLSSIVLLGKFNPAIFHPQWLDRYKVVPVQDIQSAQGDISEVQELPFKDGKIVLSKVSPMITSSEFAELNFPKYKLNVQRDRYQCLTFDRSSFSLIKDLTIKIFSLLSHTPIKAAGLNFDAHLEFEDEAEHILKSFFAKNHDQFVGMFGEDYKIKGSIITKIIGDVDTIDLDKSNKFDNSIFVHANFHKDIATEDADEVIQWIDSKYSMAIDALTKIIGDLLGEPKKIWTLQQQKK